MSLIAKSSGQFMPAPEGLWAAVAVDVVDLGVLKQEYNGKSQSVHKCRIAWEISAKMEDGRPFIVGKRYTLSLHPKASLHKDLKAWRGKAFTEDELKGFDLEKIIGVGCQLMIAQEEKDGITYANIMAITRVSKSGALAPSGQYIRVKDRDVETKPKGHGNEVGGDDDPFNGEPPPDEVHDDGDPFYDTDQIPF